MSKQIMHFWKYQGAGNDFVMVDQRVNRLLSRDDQAKIERLCDRRFGIGGDGLILLQPMEGYDFEMIYFNADGRESSMCGNGGRCIAAFARSLGVIGTQCRFIAIDGEHEAVVRETERPGAYWIELKMSDVASVRQIGDAYVLNTGSPHFIRFVENVSGLNMVEEGRAVRYSETFREQGINVNLVACPANPAEPLRIRTYERGVEDETLACGTGVTAAALASYLDRKQPAGRYEIPVQAQGGDLSVRFLAQADGTFSDIWLCGPAEFVFSGDVSLENLL